MCLKQDYSNLTGGVCLQLVPVCSQLFGAANRNSKDLCGRGLALVAASLVQHHLTGNGKCPGDWC